jgi:hypothetical protein
MANILVWYLFLRNEALSDIFRPRIVTPVAPPSVGPVCPSPEIFIWSIATLPLFQVNLKYAADDQRADAAV